MHTQFFFYTLVFISIYFYHIISHGILLRLAKLSHELNFVYPIKMYPHKKTETKKQNYIQQNLYFHSLILMHK